MAGTEHLGRSIRVEEARGRPESSAGRGRNFGERGGQR